MRQDFEEYIIFDISKRAESMKIYSQLIDFEDLRKKIFLNLKGQGAKGEDIEEKINDTIVRLRPYLRAVIEEMKLSPYIFINATISLNEFEKILKRLKDVTIGQEKEIIKAQIERRAKDYIESILRTDGRTEVEREIQEEVDEELKAFEHIKDALIDTLTESYEKYSNEYEKRFNYQ